MENPRDRRRVPSPHGQQSKTKQADARGTDVNDIMARYLREGIFTHQNRRPPRYGDFTSAEDFRTAAQAVLDTQRRFDELPSRVRDHVDNDPAKLLELVFDPERREEMEELGLLRDDQEPVAVRVIGDLGPVPQTPSTPPDGEPAEESEGG